MRRRLAYFSFSSHFFCCFFLFTLFFLLKVNVKVNGETVPFNMKIGDAGEAFFVFETNDDEDVPEHLITSPLLSATQSTAGQESENENENGFFGSDGEPGRADIGVGKKANGNAEKVGDVVSGYVGYEERKII